MAPPLELQSFDKEHVNEQASVAEVPGGQIYDNDTIELARAGKKQVLTVSECSSQMCLVASLILAAQVCLVKFGGLRSLCDGHLGRRFSVSDSSIKPHIRKKVG